MTYGGTAEGRCVKPCGGISHQPEEGPLEIVAITSQDKWLGGGKVRWI